MVVGKFVCVVKVLKECICLKLDDVIIFFFVVKFCMGFLYWLEEVEKFVKIVVDVGEKMLEFKVKGYLVLGFMYSL